jgi:hypothetical protein
VAKLAALSVLAAVALSGGQAAAAPAGVDAATKASVELTLTGGSGTRAGSSCGVQPRWRYYRVGGRVGFRGTVEGSAARKLTVVVKRCFGKSFTTVKTVTATIKADGTFKGSFLVTTVSDCFAQARLGPAASARRYFQVR